jgi:hypothetical protein
VHATENVAPHVHELRKHAFHAMIVYTEQKLYFLRVEYMY